MVDVGISIEDAIRTLRMQGVSSAFKRVLVQIEEDLQKGVLLSKHLVNIPRFSLHTLKNMIYIGEVSGNLSGVLNKVASHYEKDRKIRQKAQKCNDISSLFVYSYCGGICLLNHSNCTSI